MFVQLYLGTSLYCKRFEHFSPYNQFFILINVIFLFIFLVLLNCFPINFGKTIVIIRKKWNNHLGNENKSLDIFMNDIEMNNEAFEERFENLQTETNRISQTKNEIIEKILA